ncbi:phosphate uptake regulator, PhoU [Magnetococcus marinus MC-1]|uniref:Phosphate-specific transport system accessory protein PhoU n=1 Tax=Magnetococcus marinus (strain ATCC BAA-1437 / JCM 17883 / MC-1) TaxID=156889 RepID=A0L7V8_MAGMM|nr:phosphate signaling complex protein PhoU [Magnetococcus marinus]ABK44051.1 phosphate uptake regulator, PhoU [Magnetococcus marinus MC-1]
MPNQHTMQAFDKELRDVNALVLQMAENVLSQLSLAIESVASLDAEDALKVIEQDQQIDQLEWEVENQVIRILALREPKADDLRRVVSIMKTATDLERMGDLSANISKRALALVQNPPGSGISALNMMVKSVQAMVKTVMTAFQENDSAMAMSVWRQDLEVDELFNSVFREYLTYMMENPRNISPYTHLLFIAKNVERIGDHVTNIAENVYYIIEGKQMHGKRPKGDLTSSTVVV